MVDSILGPGGKPSRRRANTLPRTIGLGTVAVIGGIYWLADSFGADKEQLRSYLVTSVAFVGLFVVCAVVGAGGLWWVKRLRRSAGWRSQGRSAKKRSKRGQ